MVVDSTMSAPGRAYCRMPSWTRLLAQITTSASPMSLTPLTVNRSGAPGPAPMNHTLPKMRPPPGEDNRRKISPLAPYHLGRREHFLSPDPQTSPVHRALQPPRLVRSVEHLPESAPPLVADQAGGLEGAD